ncbi:UNVERIFIED_CONTAM: hypothetical protein Sindi_0831300 [Sesamum indicum]
MANQYAAQVTATQVGSYFVQQYYQVFQQQRDYVHHFYNESSSMVRVDREISESASDMVLRAKGKSTPSISSQPAYTQRRPPTADWNHVSQPSPKQSTPILSSPAVEAVEEALPSQEGESKSVYVRNLPSTVTSLDILQEFKNFGKIKQDGVFLRNRVDTGVCYAFVEFEDVQSVQNAIKEVEEEAEGGEVEGLLEGEVSKTTATGKESELMVSGVLDILRLCGAGLSLGYVGPAVSTEWVGGWGMMCKFSGPYMLSGCLLAESVLCPHLTALFSRLD